MKAVKNAYEDANRYIKNAVELLKEKAGRENGFYQDKKYVRMAGDTAWKGVLIAADQWLKRKGISWQKKSRPDVDWYISEIGKRNRKLTSHFVVAYDILHKSMGYDGIQDTNVVNTGIHRAYEIIALCERGS